MSTALFSAAATPRSGVASRPKALLLLAGITLAACIDAMNGTALSFAGAQAMGGTNATPDEFAWANMCYLIAKLSVLPLAAWLAGRVGAGRLLAGATAALIAASLAIAATDALGWILVWRTLQGAGGAAVLAGGQTVLFAVFSRRR